MLATANVWNATKGFMMNYLTDFEKFLYGFRQLKRRSVESYIKKLQYIERSIGKQLIELSSVDVLEYMLSIKKTKSINTQRIEQIALKSFFKWYCNLANINNPALNLSTIKEEKTSPDILSREDIVKLIQACGTKKFINIRNAAMICLLADTGIRVGELIRLRVGNVSKEGNHFILSVTGDAAGTKTYRQRRIPFAELHENGFIAEPWAAYWGKIKYMEQRHSEAPLFQRINECQKPLLDPLTANDIQQIVTRLARKAGIEKRVSPHSFRHFYGTWCIVNGLRIEILKERLGHKCLDNTYIYVHLADTLRDDSLKFNPMTGFKADYKGFVKAIKDK